MMHFDQYGNPANPTLLLLHGAAATDTFCHQYVFQDRFHLVVPHLPGSGKEVDKTYDPESTLTVLLEVVRHIGKEKIAVMGHSLGGELAVALVARHPECFSRAVFLSAWVCSSEKSIRLYTKLAKYTCATLKWSGLIRWQAKYWGYTPEQAEFMVDYSRRITPEQYLSWFSSRVHLDDLPQYGQVRIPMLAVCGSKEVAEMKNSLAELGKRNPACKTMLLEGVNHDFPLRAPDRINPILLDFLT